MVKYLLCCNPGITHDDPNNKAYWIGFEWPEELIYEFADKFGCTVDEKIG